MSEEILSAIIHLLAIVAKEDGINTEEIASVESYLDENLNEETANRYLNLFKEISERSEETSQSEEDQIQKICDKINQEQTAQQKAVVVLNLIILIAADGIVTERESELLYYISDKINIAKEVTELIKAFVIYQERSKMVSSSMLIIDDGSQTLPSECKHLIYSELDGFIFVLRIPGIDIYLAKYIGERGMTLNGAPMKSNHIYHFKVGSVIKSAEMPSIYFSEVISAFTQFDQDSRISFVARNVTYKFKNGDIGLRNINIEEGGGRLIALMGGSGAGKSTLLNVLNSNEKPAEGSVRINGIDIHKGSKKIEGVIGYVPQDDLLIEELTVFDNLYFAAKLCFKDYSEVQLNELVDNTLRSLGLHEKRHLRVGSPLAKTISGGQRKRLNIGLELLREPAVLFVDEPTSGLSSRDSENIMDLLKDLTLKGKMIFVVIHQPSEDIFKMFDKLIILDVGGYQIYYGNPVEGISYFKDQVKMVEQSSSANPELIFNIIEAKVVDEYGNLTTDRKKTPKQWYQLFLDKISIKRIHETEIVPEKSLKIPNKIQQIGIFSLRDLKTKLGNIQYLVINFLEAPVLALLLAYIVRYIPRDSPDYVFSENPNVAIFYFMSVIVALFMGLTVSAEEIIKDRKILKREAFLNLSRISYLSSKIFILFSLSGIQTITFVLIGSWLLGIQGMIFPFWLVLFSVSCFANVLGLNISAAFKSAVTVYILIPLLVIPQLILSGVVVNFDQLNPTIIAKDRVPVIGDVMASRWAFEALVVTQFKDNDYEENFFDFDRDMAEAEFKTGYLLPQLLEDLDQVLTLKAENGNKETIKAKFRLLRNEFAKELSFIGMDKFPELEQMNSDQFDHNIHEKAGNFVKRLISYYNERFKKANADKQSVLSQFTSSDEKMTELKQLRETYTNESISLLVKNMGSRQRLIQVRDEYIQKIYPIYQEPKHPTHMFDFRTLFYFPEKHLLGSYIDTLYFNTYMIWFMTIILFITLYYEVLKKLVSGNRN